jgi:hypothetical protein
MKAMPSLRSAMETGKQLISKHRSCPSDEDASCSKIELTPSVARLSEPIASACAKIGSRSCMCCPTA